MTKLKGEALVAFSAKPTGSWGPKLAFEQRGASRLRAKLSDFQHQA